MVRHYNHYMLDNDNKTKDYKAHAWLIIYVQLHNTHTTTVICTMDIKRMVALLVTLCNNKQVT